MKNRKILLFLFLTLFLTNTIFAVGFTRPVLGSKITGIVRDGATTYPLSGVKITLLVFGVAEDIVYTDSLGVYTVTYAEIITSQISVQLKVEKSGYMTVYENSILLPIGNPPYDEDDIEIFEEEPIPSPVTKYAVIVGISDYKVLGFFDDLFYCDEDATDWYNHLWGSQQDFDYVWVYGDGHPNRYPKYDGIATEYNVKQALINMVNLADENDVICFISSGHGYGTGTGSSALCMWDCGDGENGETGYLYDSELKTILVNSVANKMFVFIDHCFSGGFGNDLMSMGNKGHLYLATACTYNGMAHESFWLQNGHWTYYFLQKSWINHFGGSDAISMEAIFTYAHDNFPFDGEDEPQEYDGNTGLAFYLR